MVRLLLLDLRKMTSKYLEIDSSYRNRTTWPLQSKFQVLMTHQYETFSDGISLAAPLTTWQSHKFISFTPLFSATITGTVESAVNIENGLIMVTVNTGGIFLQTGLNYYHNAIFRTSDFNTTSVIVSYENISPFRGIFIVHHTALIVIADVVTITDPTDIATNRIYVPNNPDTMIVHKILFDQTLGLYTTIKSIDHDVITTDSAIPGWLATDTFSIRTEVPELYGVVAGSTPSVINLGPNNLSNVVGSFIRIQQINPIGNEEIRSVISYNPVTFLATVSSPFSVNPNGYYFELLQYSRDNVSTFTFSGTLQQEFTITKIKLINLMIPNVIINDGGTITDYPYIYLKLSPLDTHNSYTISSNNPKSVFALFRATLVPGDNGNHKFVSYSGNGSVVVLPFKLYNNFNFEVTLPNGKSIETAIKDTQSPSEPNPLVQISCMLEIIRI